MSLFYIFIQVYVTELCCLISKHMSLLLLKQDVTVDGGNQSAVHSAASTLPHHSEDLQDFKVWLRQVILPYYHLAFRVQNNSCCKPSSGFTPLGTKGMIAFLQEFQPEYCFKMFPFSFPKQINFFFFSISLFPILKNSYIFQLSCGTCLTSGTLILLML